MNGNSKIVLQPRDLHLLREVSAMRIMDSELAKIVAGFGSTTRTNTRLLALTRAGLLRRFFLGTGGGSKALYSLSPKGAQLVGVPARGPRRPQGALLIADNFVRHQLTVNGIYCALRYQTISVPQVTFRHWVTFHEPLMPGLNLIPDGFVEFFTPTGVVACFLEVDLGHESLTVWKEKARRYLQLALSGEFQKRFRQDRFRVFVVANSERRLHSIKNAVAEITRKIFWFAPLEAIAEDFFAVVWFRATENQPTSPIETTP
jgi:hypothetical protein